MGYGVQPLEMSGGACDRLQVKKTTIKIDYLLHDQVLDAVTCAKYLEVDISSDLSWTPPPPTVLIFVYQKRGFFWGFVVCFVFVASQNI